MQANTLLLNEDNIHQRVIVDTLLEAKQTVWIATANLKDMHIKAHRGFEPILQTFDEMVRAGVRIRIIHSDLPSKSFRNTLEEYPVLQQNMELQVCPRCHWKMVIVDSHSAYFGSANFTGAGLGVKNIQRRNLEIGTLTTDPAWVQQLELQFDEFWMGNFCNHCALRKKCPDPIDDDQF
ncbi:MAG: phospholipase [Methylococcales bacterium]|jgi:phosphatidylserine/phosphatidylglycerophosphate/cardiolipin synthase-like enzyme|nr:phospholipase [Methylococcales bacterium]MBT7445027.1 phospholipase [Methylococcales bacterium]